MGGGWQALKLLFFYILLSLLYITWAYIEVLTAALSLSEETANLSAVYNFRFRLGLGLF